MLSKCFLDNAVIKVPGAYVSNRDNLLFWYGLMTFYCMCLAFITGGETHRKENVAIVRHTDRAITSWSYFLCVTKAVKINHFRKTLYGTRFHQLFMPIVRSFELFLFRYSLSSLNCVCPFPQNSNNQGFIHLDYTPFETIPTSKYNYAMFISVSCFLWLPQYFLVFPHCSKLWDLFFTAE